MFKRKQDTCATIGCEGKPIGTIVDHFNVAGVKSVAFYRKCEECFEDWRTDSLATGPAVSHNYEWKPDQPSTK